MSKVRCRGGVENEAMNWSMKTSCNRRKERTSMAFSKRDKVGWLASSRPSGERPARSLKSGSQRSTSWSFWSG